MRARNLHYRSPRLFGVLGLQALVVASSAFADTCRVTPVGTPAGDGSDWSMQSMDLPTALSASACTEVWVAAGLYKPTSGSDRTISFRPMPGVEVDGGFAGGETSREQRDPAANPTLLSGDIDGNDTGVDGIDADTSQIVGSNSYHVVYFDGASPAGQILADTVLDGFIITGGSADGIDPYRRGGGAYCNGVYGTHECSPTLRNLSFSGNRAIYGGGLCVDGSYGLSSPVLANVTFSGNRAAGGGALISIGYQGQSSPTLGNVTFSDNSADNGGAVYNAGYEGTATMALNNVTFNGNSAGNGASAFYNEGGTATLNNVIVWDESAPSAGSGTSDTYGGVLSISDSVLHACLNVDICNNIITNDPLLGSLQYNGGYTMTLVPSGSALDAGNDGTCLATDQRGVSRPQGSHCDVGAVEVVVDQIFVDGFE